MENSVDMIFADPPYFLSNGGITCHAGKMVSVNKGKWDKSKGVEENHEFTLEWLKACQRVLKPNGTIWVSGTTHIIYSIGFAMQKLGFDTPASKGDGILRQTPFECLSPDGSARPEVYLETHYSLYPTQDCRKDIDAHEQTKT